MRFEIAKLVYANGAIVYELRGAKGGYPVGHYQTLEQARREKTRFEEEARGPVSVEVIE